MYISSRGQLQVVKLGQGEEVGGNRLLNCSSSCSSSASAKTGITLDRARERTVQLRAQPGDLWIDMNQPRGRLAALILEPRSSSSLFRTPAHMPLVTTGRPLPVYRIPK